MKILQDLLDRLQMGAPGPRGWERRCHLCARWKRDSKIRARFHDGFIEVDCERGCKTEDILDSVGLERKDLFVGMNWGSWVTFRLIAITESRALLFRDRQARPWAKIFPPMSDEGNDDSGEERIYLLSSTDFREWLSMVAFDLDGYAPSLHLVRKAARIMAGKLPLASAGSMPHRICTALCSFARRHGTWKGGVGELLDLLNSENQNPQPGTDWPESARTFRSMLDELAPSLRKEGTDVSVGGRQGGTGRRLVCVRLLDEPHAKLTAASPSANGT